MFVVLLFGLCAARVVLSLSWFIGISLNDKSLFDSGSVRIWALFVHLRYIANIVYPVVIV